MNHLIRLKRLMILMINFPISSPSINSFKFDSIDSFHSQTVDGQSIDINPHQINLIITSNPILQSHLIQNCPSHYLFSITPSKLDSSLIYQFETTATNQSEGWNDDLNHYLSHLQEIETSNQSDLTTHSNQLVFESEDEKHHCDRLMTYLALRIHQTALVFVPHHSLKSFTERLPIHMELLIHLNQSFSSRKEQLNRMNSLENSNEKLKKEIFKMRYQPKIDELMNSLNLNDFIHYSKIMIGNSLESKWITRNTFSNGILLAFNWLKDQFEQFGIGCDFQFYQVGFAPNLICNILSTHQIKRNDLKKDKIVLSSHLDSRGDFGSLSTPGADNNAFGCSILLLIAKSIKRSQLSLKKDIYFVVFSGTEQGAWGSQSLSNKWKNENFEILLLLNLNMIGYRVPGESLQLGLPKENQFNSIPNWYIGNITNLYLPELYIGQTPVRDLDSQNFGFNNGIPFTSLFERVGPIGNPFYHTSFDLIEKVGYDLIQALTIGKAMYAAVLQLAL